MLRGMHDTTVAKGRNREDTEKMTQTLNAISDQPVKLPEWGGGYLNIRYDAWKPRYADEYTGEIF